MMVPRHDACNSISKLSLSATYLFATPSLQFRLKARRHAAELAQRAKQMNEALGESPGASSRGQVGATTPVHSAKFLREREIEGGLWGMAQAGGFLS
jgi:hypothetical protein